MNYEEQKPQISRQRREILQTFGHPKRDPADDNGAKERELLCSVGFRHVLLPDILKNGDSEGCIASLREILETATMIKAHLPCRLEDPYNFRCPYSAEHDDGSVALFMVLPDNYQNTILLPKRVSPVLPEELFIGAIEGWSAEREALYTQLELSLRPVVQQRHLARVISPMIQSYDETGRWRLHLISFDVLSDGSYHIYFEIQDSRMSRRNIEELRQLERASKIANDLFKVELKITQEKLEHVLSTPSAPDRLVAWILGEVEMRGGSLSSRRSPELNIKLNPRYYDEDDDPLANGTFYFDQNGKILEADAFDEECNPAFDIAGRRIDLS